MAVCYYKYEIKGKLVGVGEKTLAALVDSGLAERGPSPRHPGAIGWAITEAGKAAL